MSQVSFVAVAAVLFVGARDKYEKVSASAERQTTDAPCVLDVIRRRFHANDSLIAELIPCSYEEKICFRYNMLYHPLEDKCRGLGEEVNSFCTVKVDRQQFEHGSGHLVGVCAPAADPCRGHRMAFDGRCYRKRTVAEVLCACAAPPTPHFLGGVECRCAAPRYLHVKQPAEERSCRVPDLRFPDAHRFSAPVPSLAAAAARRRRARGEERGRRCAPAQSECFARGEAWVESARACFALLQRGPCPAGHVVALTDNGWETGCVDTRRGCLPGYKRLLYDQLCHSDRELEIAVPGNVLLGVYGEYEIWDSDVEVGFYPRILNDTCDIFVKIGSVSSEIKHPPFPWNSNYKEHALKMK